MANSSPIPEAARDQAVNYAREFIDLANRTRRNQTSDTSDLRFTAEFNYDDADDGRRMWVEIRLNAAMCHPSYVLRITIKCMSNRQEDINMSAAMAKFIAGALGIHGTEGAGFKVPAEPVTLH
jgi:hypothetical protein